MLLGSSVLPTMIDISGVQTQLGDVVRFAYGYNGYTTPKEWNDTDPLVREYMLVKAIYKLREAKKCQ
jgi:hypothetical protein